MEPKLRPKAHFLHAVMYFMKFPQPVRFMEPAMNVPLNKIGNNQHNDQFGPYQQGLHFKRHNILNPEKAQKIVEQGHPNIRNGIISNKRKQKEIEENIEAVQPKAFSENFLVVPPGQ